MAEFVESIYFWSKRRVGAANDGYRVVIEKMSV